MTDAELMLDARVKKIVEENEMLLNRIKTLKEENEVLRQIGDVEILSTEDVAIELGKCSIYSIYDWYNTLNQFKNLGLSFCKVKGVKDEQ